MDIGERLGQIRRSKGFSQARLASLSRVPRYTINLIEKGGVEPRISTLQKLAQELGVNVKRFL